MRSDSKQLFTLIFCIVILSFVIFVFLIFINTSGLSGSDSYMKRNQGAAVRDLKTVVKLFDKLAVENKLRRSDFFRLVKETSVIDTTEYLFIEDVNLDKPDIVHLDNIRVYFGEDGNYNKIERHGLDRISADEKWPVVSIPLSLTFGLLNSDYSFLEGGTAMLSGILLLIFLIIGMILLFFFIFGNRGPLKFYIAKAIFLSIHFLGFVFLLLRMKLHQEMLARYLFNVYPFFSIESLVQGLHRWFVFPAFLFDIILVNFILIIIVLIMEKNILKGK